MTTLEDLFQEGILRLRRLARPEIDVKMLLLHSASIPEETFYTHPRRRVPRRAARRFRHLVSRRENGWPLAYIVGKKEFWSIPFEVSPGVLIPRPETELLVEKVLDLELEEDSTLVDVGTGCGNVALALAREMPRSRIIAIDSSSRALRTAKKNAVQQGQGRIEFHKGDMLSPLKRMGLEKNCDCIVSNPPYVSEEEWEDLVPEITDHEPRQALVAGPTGLEVITRLIKEAPACLKRGGYLALEIGGQQEKDTLALFGDAWSRTGCFRDLSGIPRVILGEKN